MIPGHYRLMRGIHHELHLAYIGIVKAFCFHLPQQVLSIFERFTTIHGKDIILTIDICVPHHPRTETAVARSKDFSVWKQGLDFYALLLRNITPTFFSWLLCWDGFHTAQHNRIKRQGIMGGHPGQFFGETHG